MGQMAAIDCGLLCSSDIENFPPAVTPSVRSIRQYRRNVAVAITQRRQRRHPTASAVFLRNTQRNTHEQIRLQIKTFAEIATQRLRNAPGLPVITALTIGGPTMTAKLSDSERDQAAQIVALFSVFVHAWATNDFDEAARTRGRLKDLGFSIQVRSPLNTPANQSLRV